MKNKHTEEETKKAHKISNAKWYKNSMKDKSFREKRKKAHKISNAKWYKNNVDKAKIYCDKYRKSNVNKIKETAHEYKEINKELLKEKRIKYQKEHPNKVKENRNKYHKNRKQRDPLFKLLHNVRNSIYNAITSNGYTKKLRTHNILGCSFVEFKIYLEAQFLPWMNWDNHGKYNGELNYGWDIDHIIPLSSALTEEDILKLSHYTNLQPLCSYTNRYIKKDKLKLLSEG